MRNQLNILSQTLFFHIADCWCIEHFKNALIWYNAMPGFFNDNDSTTIYAHITYPCKIRSCYIDINCRKYVFGLFMLPCRKKACPTFSTCQSEKCRVLTMALVSISLGNKVILWLAKTNSEGIQFCKCTPKAVVAVTLTSKCTLTWPTATARWSKLSSTLSCKNLTRLSQLLRLP